MAINSVLHWYLCNNKRMKQSFPCINVLPSPIVIMCCSLIREAVRAATHYYTRALQMLLYRKDCYIVIVIYLPFWCKCLRYNQRTAFRNFWPRALTSINTRLRRASMPLKPAPDIVWCLSQLHWCSRYNHIATFQNHSPRASTFINTRLRRASFPLKPAPDIVWCLFPL